MEPSRVTRVQDDLQARVLVNRIIDPERTRPVVVITFGSRTPGKQLSAERIATGIGDGVEVAVIDTGRLTYTLRDGLPDDADVFGDAARTYPVGIAWHTRPERAPLRYANTDTDLHRLEQQIIADARSALRAAAAPRLAPAVARPVAKPMAPGLPVAATPATLPGAPAVHADHPRDLDTSARPIQPPASSSPGPAPTAGSSPEREGAPTPTQVAPVAARPQGPTPTRPYGPPPVPAVRLTTRSTALTPTPAGPPPRLALGSVTPRLNRGDLWHAWTEAEGRALALHLMSAARTHPVLVISTPTEQSGPLLDADDLWQRVGTISDVVVLHHGPASWTLAEGVPPRTQVYGGAGRVYPVDRGWLADPHRAPLRFCWPNDVPTRVADTLEDDAYAAATLAGSLTQAATPTATTRPASGVIKGFLGRHNALLRLSDRTQAVLTVDELLPGIEPERLLRRGMHMAGRVVVDGAIAKFIPDPATDDPVARLAHAYRPGDLVLARITKVASSTATALLHPHVEVAIGTEDEDLDLRSLLETDDVVTLELTARDPWHAFLAHTDTPSVACAPVLPGGPAWLTEADLAQPTAAPEPEPQSAPADPAPTTPAYAPEPSIAPAEPVLTPVLRPTPANAALHGQVLALQAQLDDLSALLQTAQAQTEAQRRAAKASREDVKKLRNQVRSQKDQMQSYKEQVEGTALFDDPAEQLAHDVYIAWLRRITPSERATWPLRNWRVGPQFLDSVESLEGISRTKIIDVIVEVITGRVKEISGRDLHALRDGESGPQRGRHDGARAWRCALQVSAPSARRLHFWTLPDNSVELDQVGIHDDAIVA